MMTLENSIMARLDAQKRSGIARQESEQRAAAAFELWFESEYNTSLEAVRVTCYEKQPGVFAVKIGLDFDSTIHLMATWSRGPDGRYRLDGAGDIWRAVRHDTVSRSFDHPIDAIIWALGQDRIERLPQFIAAQEDAELPY